VLAGVLFCHIQAQELGERFTIFPWWLFTDLGRCKLVEFFINILRELWSEMQAFFSKVVNKKELQHV